MYIIYFHRPLNDAKVSARFIFESEASYNAYIQDHEENEELNMLEFTVGFFRPYFIRLLKTHWKKQGQSDVNDVGAVEGDDVAVVGEDGDNLYDD